MRLSTSTNIIDMVPDAPGGCISVQEAMTRCKEAGFSVMDFCFCDHSVNHRFMSRDDWQDEVELIAEHGKKIKVEFSQSHLEFYNVCDAAFPNRDDIEALIRKEAEASARLGVKWAVIHPGSYYENDAYSYKKSMECNVEYFKRKLELAEKNGIGLAVENIPDFDGKRHFSSSPEELIELIDRLDSSHIGICWDFGHANLSRLDQVYWLKQIGRRLKAVHVADNYGKADDHLAPFWGTVKWKEIMPVLKSIGYQYDFTFEIHKMFEGLPMELRQGQLREMVKLGEYLIKLAG